MPIYPNDLVYQDMFSFQLSNLLATLHAQLPERRGGEGAEGACIGIWGSERICAYIDYLVGELSKEERSGR